jgi:hypothetical protein
MELDGYEADDVIGTLSKRLLLRVTDLFMVTRIKTMGNVANR